MTAGVCLSAEETGKAVGVRLAVSPGPTDDEAAALVLSVLIGDGNDATPRTSDAAPRESPWVLAGRRAARRGIANGPAVGWGRHEWEPRR